MKYLILCLFVFIHACSDGGGQDPGAGLINSQTFSGSTAGEAVSLEYQYSLNQATINAKMTSASSVLSGVVTTGAHIYKVTYVTNDANKGDDTFNASGLLMIPYSLADSSDNSAPWVVVSHGTIVDNASAPTNSLSEGLFEAGLGFITLVPDYIGFGESYSSDPATRIHPYIISDSYGSDGVNMMNAVKSILTNQGITLGRLYLKGYSEGGYATLALQKELESNHSSSFTITASAPSAGPYSTMLMSETLTSSSGRLGTISPTLFGYLSTSYFYNESNIQNQYDEFSDVFLQTNNYNPALLFNGSKSSTVTESTYAGLGISTMATLMDSDVLDAMQTKASGLTAELTSTLTNLAAAAVAAAAGDAGTYSSKAAAAAQDVTDMTTILSNIGDSELLSSNLYANDLVFTSMTGYRPGVTTIFYHCSDDATIPSAIGQAAYGFFATSANFSGANSNVSFVGSGTGGHSACPYIFTPAICFAQIEASGGSLSTLNSVTSNSNYCN
jgi:hypothetical protein